ncbi:MAG: sigma-70 family RNA polymerase sigma factor [Acidobacteriota bacterium]
MPREGANPGITTEPTEVTRLLVEWKEGRAEAFDELTPLVYEELHFLAHRYLRKQQHQDLLQTTVLVHEAYLRLVGEDINWQGRDHFFAVASTVMRRILVDFARQRFAKKRGSGQVAVPLEGVEHRLAADAGPEAQLLALHEALEDLARIDARKARILELRYFGGLAIKETARVLEISAATVEREMKMARAWLAQALAP